SEPLIARTWRLSAERSRPMAFSSHRRGAHGPRIVRLFQFVKCLWQRFSLDSPNQVLNTDNLRKRCERIGMGCPQLPAHSRDPLLRLANLGHGRQVLGAIPDAVDERDPARVRDGVDERLALLVLRQLEVHAGDAVEQFLDQWAVLLALLDALLD